MLKPSSAETTKRVNAERTILAKLIFESFAYKQLPQDFTSDAFEFPEHEALFSKIKSSFIDKGEQVNFINLQKQNPDQTRLIAELTQEKIIPDDEFKPLSAGLLDHRFTPTSFKPCTNGDLTNILDLTIKADNENKVLTFLGMLSCYTESDQLNISFNAPSSSGKSYIALEVSQLFPQEDVREIGHCSPTSFFHDYGTFDKEKGGYIADLSRKIIIFLDQPHDLLLQYLRPLLSHDQKEIQLKITDKTQKGGLRTKNIFLIGFPVIIFCTAGLKLDLQESTRFILLSPETSQEKIRFGIKERVKKETDSELYRQNLKADPGRLMLQERIRAIREANIQNIKIISPEKIQERFFKKHRFLQPRHQRDIGRIMGLIKASALLNLWFRPRKDSTIWTIDEDIESAFFIWEKISESQELNLPPFVYDLYREVIEKAYSEKNQSSLVDQPSGVSRQEIIKKHYEVNHQPLPDWLLRRQILPMLEASGLIFLEKDKNDLRKTLVYPLPPAPISQEQEIYRGQAPGGEPGIDSPPTPVPYIFEGRNREQTRGGAGH